MREEKVSECERGLHKQFKVWDEFTVITRYLVVLALGMLGINLGNPVYIYILLLFLSLNAYCYYTMKVILERVVIERVAVNYGKKKGI